MADTVTTETVTPAAPSNESGTTTAPVLPDNGSTAELEAIRKELEQTRMRNNQLANQLEEKAKAEAEARQKQLEEKEEYKALYEQNQARLKEIEEREAAKAREAELTNATGEVFKAYPDTVVELAKTAGLSLTDDSEAAQAALREKLDAFQRQVGATNAPNSNNPHTPAPEAIDRHELTKRNEHGISPMAAASANGDDSVIKSYIRDLPAVQRMKEISQGS